MKTPLRYLTLVVLLVDFALLGMLPTLFILALGSERSGPGRYRGALAAGRTLVRVIAWMVRAKALYALILLTAVFGGWAELPWWAVAPLVGLLLGWEAGLEATRALARFLKERAEGKPGPSFPSEAPPGKVRTGPNRIAARLLLAAAGTLVVEMSLATYVVCRLFFPD